MFESRLLSLAEIAALERGYQLGAPTLAHAVHALETRWRHHLRDEETALRYAFLAWLARVDAPWETGLDERVPSAGRIVEEFDVARLSGESRFIVGWLAIRNPAALGDACDWAVRGPRLLRDAAELEPRSALITAWPWFTGDTTAQDRIRDRRTALRNEIGARFGGRGALGGYLVRELQLAVDRALVRPRLV